MNILFMQYDANGNLIYDEDRDISLIKYNVLNLPDTIQFRTGHQILNMYDAAGHKYKSIVYTNTSPAGSQYNAVAHYTYALDTVEWRITEYNGNAENYYTAQDTTWRVFNSIGYCENDTFYHYVKDHIGSNCAVVHSEMDTAVQITLYYASGVPMAQSTNRDKQPYLYNGKEFIEAHSWNTYDYGFRSYYATIGRFTSMDPLAEQTPWQSPYSYANNNFINNIDWMGLGGIYGGIVSTYGWMAQDHEGNVVDWGDDNNDWHVYEVDEDWDGTYQGLKGHSQIIGWEIFDNNGNRPRYIKGAKSYYLGITQTSYYAHGETYIVAQMLLKYGNQIVKTSWTIDSSIEAVIHYYFGFGLNIQNGSNTIREFMQTPEYLSILSGVSNNQTHGYGCVNMRDRVFHIGRTGYSFHVNGNMIVIGFALNDGFWDPDYFSEKVGEKIQCDFTDGKGPNLEYGGYPYDYIPNVIVIWK